MHLITVIYSKVAIMSKECEIRHTGRDNLVRIMAFLLGAVFIVSGYLKGVNLDSFADTIHNFSGLLGMPAGQGKMPAFLICLAEVGMGYAVFVRPLLPLFLPVYLIVSTFFTFITYVNLSSPYGGIESCGCFGELIHTTPLQSFVKSVAVMGASILLACLYYRGPKGKDRIGNRPGKRILLMFLIGVLPILYSGLFMGAIPGNIHIVIYISLAIISLIYDFQIITHLRIRGADNTGFSYGLFRQKS